MNEHHHKVPESRYCQLLERVTAIYEKNFIDNPSAKNCLEQYGIIDASLLDKHRIGFCDGGLNTILPLKGTLREELNAVGIFSYKGYEIFTGCVVVPVIDMKADVQNLCGIDIIDNDALPVFLGGRPKGVWNEACAKIHDEIIIVDSVFNGLSVATAGSDNVIAVPCLEELTDNKIMDLKVQGINKMILVFAGDASGVSTPIHPFCE